MILRASGTQDERQRRQGRLALVLAGMLLAAASCGAQSQDDPKRDIPEVPIFGISHAEKWNLGSLYRWDDALSDHQRVQRLVGDLGELGVGWYRPNLNWREVQSELAPTLTSAAELTDAMIDAAASGAPGSGFDWTVFDLLLEALLENGIEVLPVIGNSDDWRIPRLPASEDAANPDAIGEEAYLLHLSLYARAAVRRYGDQVSIWQVENELNVAIFTTALPTGRKGGVWADEDFLERLLSTLVDAVSAEEPSALVTTNFHTDLPADLHDWRESVQAWSRYLDIIGIDVYPNYLESSPVRGEEVAARVREARDLVQDAKPVLVLETGYPSGPTDDGFSEAAQAEYMATACRAAIGAGAIGFFVYTLTSPESSDPFGTGFQAVENYWGLFRADNTAKPAFAALQDAIGELSE